MKRGVSVLVLHKSKEVAGEIVKLIRTVTAVKDVFFGSSFEKPIQLLYTDKVDLVICGLQLTDEDFLKILEIRQTAFPFSLIMLDNNITNYIERFEKPEHFFIIPEERIIEMLPPVITRLTEVIRCSVGLV